MHLWNIEALTDELRTDKLSESDTFKYFFVVMTLSTLTWFLSWVFGVSTPLKTIPYGFVFPLLSVGIVLYGMIQCFRSFHRNNGRQFVQKFICLLLPANLRAFIFCLPLYIVASFAGMLFPEEERHDFLIIANSFIIAVIMTVQFISIYRHLGKITEPRVGPERAAA